MNNPRPQTLPIGLNKADLVAMGQIDVGALLHHQYYGRGTGWFAGLVQVRLPQSRTGHIGLDLRKRYNALVCFQVCL
jgi:hypothetical protein